MPEVAEGAVTTAARPRRGRRAPPSSAVDPELERLLAEEEEIERRTRERAHEAPHFRKEED